MHFVLQLFALLVKCFCLSLLRKEGHLQSFHSVFCSRILLSYFKRYPPFSSAQSSVLSWLELGIFYLSYPLTNCRLQSLLESAAMKATGCCDNRLLDSLLPIRTTVLSPFPSLSARILQH